MQGSKISLSPTEMTLFEDAAVILTKNSILQKTVLLLRDVQAALMNEAQQFEWVSSPKISRGENYVGLPYVVLDYPRIAAGDDLFFIRSLFWWGHFFSSTLQLSGRYAEAGRVRLAAGYGELARRHYFIGNNQNPWVHHFGKDNYIKISELTKEEFTRLLWNQPHIKIAVHWPLNNWEMAAEKLMESWKLLMHLIS